MFGQGGGGRIKRCNLVKGHAWGYVMNISWTYVHHMFTTCSWHVHHMFMTCSPNVQNMLWSFNEIICLQDMFSKCSQHVHHMFTKLFTTCSPHTHYNFTTFSPNYSQHVHNIFTTCSQYVHKMFSSQQKRMNISQKLYSTLFSRFPEQKFYQLLIFLS